jgi:hypothetical protein
MKRILANIFSQVGKIWLEKSIANQIKVNIVVISIQFLAIVFFITDLPPQIPLFYSRPWGESQLTSPLMLIILPIFSIAFFIVDTLLAAAFLEKKIFFSRLLIYSSNLVSIFNLITIIKIIFLFA